MIRHALAAAAALALAGCSVQVDSPLLAEAPKVGAPKHTPITSPGQFLDAVAGKPITYDNGAVLVANPDGTLGGTIDGQPAAGRWTFSGGQLCRAMALGGAQFPEVCNLIEVGEGVVRFLNLDGTLSTEAALG